MTSSTPPLPPERPDAASRTDRAASFDKGADVYRATRPTYPDAAVDWLLPSGARQVLDLAAGTGKLTERLVARGLDVVAVEPSDAMRTELSRAVPAARTLAGTADALPLPDASVDAVLVAQAWHWFTPSTALPEIARVLRPGGRLGLVWNVRDNEVDWVGRYTEIIHRGDALDPSYRVPILDHRFTPAEHTTVPWADRVGTRSLRALAASRSYLLTLPEARRDELLDEVDELAHAHPDLAGRDEVDLPYRAECWRADLAEAG
ncbi:class I SAM-dependent methyltransferase [Oerskovia flava]|uniref:class I SAM-dependent methyltransferase n=1 Tax=Oerskovia flava TaxID=2986422 RepID=UPI00224024C6|nr:class I SAM-dependent methyltransferase [Oerskovia sp. JB1-3-2]